jgi:predicted anti-sigma-YlaC factor YlaD
MCVRECIDGETLMAWHDGQLRREEACAVEDHLKECPRCRQTVIELARVDRLVDQLPDPDISPNFVGHTIKRALRFVRLRQHITRQVIPAAAALVIALLGLEYYKIVNTEPKASAAAIRNHEMVENVEAVRYVDLLKEFTPADMPATRTD